MTPRDQDTITQMLKYKHTEDRKGTKNTLNICDLTRKSYNVCLVHVHMQEDAQIIIEALVFARGKIRNKNDTDKYQDIKRGNVKDLPMAQTSPNREMKGTPWLSRKAKESIVLTLSWVLIHTVSLASHLLLECCVCKLNTKAMCLSTLSFLI